MGQKYYEDDYVTLYHGDCREVLHELADSSIDSVVTDPPYELAFMGKGWDATGIAYDTNLWRECLRVLKPGGHILAFGGSRTWHRLAVAVEDAGFEIRDSIAWLYGSGFPKSLNVSKAIDKAAGALAHESAPATPDAERWQGWGTALKPAFEPIVVGRKPLAEKTVARNVLEHGTGAINIDACRVATTDRWEASGIQSAPGSSLQGSVDGSLNVSVSSTHEAGRWPANVLLDEHAAAWVDEQSGHQKGGVAVKRNRDGKPQDVSSWALPGEARPDHGYGGQGGASRFFYTAKAPKSERPNVDGVQHPTVKPLAIMRWLLRLVTPPGGVVLDPFAGSGTTAEACVTEELKCVAVELEETYLPLIVQRLTKPIEMALDLGGTQ